MNEARPETPEQPPGQLAEDPAGEPADAAAELETEGEVEGEPQPAGEGREQQLTEQLQRLAADYANYQKRIQRDRAKWTQDAVRGLLKDLLPVLDNLDQAIAAFDGEVKDPQTYCQGVVLVRDELMRQLKGYEVERIDAEQGIPFDLDRHEAIMVQEVDGIEGKQVSFLARAGYTLGETVLRPAQVGVAQPKG